jgi:acetyl esterase/lipase
MLVIDVWPDNVPNDYGEIGAETFHPPPPGAPEDTKWLTNVTHPTLTVYLPAKDKATHTAILICPGGGYWSLGWDLEGEEIADWLNSIGVTGIVLKYRVPRRPGQPVELPPPGPLQDAQRALSLVRSKALEWDLDPKRIGIIGFSAGAHLALAAATNFDRRTYASLDDVDQESCRPDFAISLYPGYLVETDNQVLAPAIQIPAETPPVFLAHADDDSIATVENSVAMYLALRRAGVSAELHIYATGGHGFGVRKYDHPISSWPERCADWLQAQGVLKPHTGQ